MALTKITGKGVGTLVSDLTVTSTDADANVGPVLNLQRDSASPADNDVMGIINFKGENDASEAIDYASINAYILDASDGTEDGRVIHRLYKDGTNVNLVDMKSSEVVFNEDGADIDFRVESDTESDLFVINAGTSSIGIGTDSPDGKLQVLASASEARNPMIRLHQQSTSDLTGIIMQHGRGLSGFTGTMVSFRRNDGTEVGSITIGVSSTGFNTSSDHRLKENVTSDWDATTRLKQLNPVRFNFITDADTTVDGFLAHEVQSVVPEAISGTHNEVQVWQDGEELPDGVSVGDNKLDEDGNTIPIYQGIDQSKLVPLLVKTIQELEARITALENA